MNRREALLLALAAPLAFMGRSRQGRISAETAARLKALKAYWEAAFAPRPLPLESDSVVIELFHVPPYKVEPRRYPNIEALTR